MTGLVRRWGIPTPLKPFVALPEGLLRVAEPRHDCSIDTGVARLLFLGPSVDEHGESVDRQEESNHQEREHGIPARPGSRFLPGASRGVEVDAVIFHQKIGSTATGTGVPKVRYL